MPEKIINPNIREKIENPQPSTEQKKERVEQQLEQAPIEKLDTEEEKKALENIGEASGIVASAQVQDSQKKREEAIDKILAEGLDEVFIGMTPGKQKEFKQKGEETTKKIYKLLGDTKVKMSKIVSLIRKWLRIIPGVNKFFLEQESKIKADKVIDIKNKF